MVEINNNNNTFNLTIDGYEFPARGNSEYDDNWLMVHVSAAKEDLHWQVTDPCLLTWELKDLSDWFAALSENKPVTDDEIGFVEPNLLFKCKQKGEEYELTVRFSIELLPPGWDRSKECSITFMLSSNELKRIAREFQDEQTKFPYRNAMNLS